MKKHAVVLLSAVMIILHAASASAAVDLSIGGTAWYTWWNPAWADAKSSIRALSPSPALIVMSEDASDFKPSSNAMAGPMISIGFLERWSIQSVFTIGRLHFRSEGGSKDIQMNAGPWAFTPSYKKYDRDVLKWDSDTSIGCALHRMVKIFAGFKHQGYSYREKMKDVFLQADPAYFTRSLTDDVRSYGGGLGLGITIPVIAEFYIMMSVSGIALWSVETIKVNQSGTYILSENDGYFPLLLFPQKGHFLSYGGTASLSLAYNIEKINTTLALGGRYQLLYNRQNYSKNNPWYNDVTSNIIDKKFDHFFGITLSAIYTFHIGKKS